ncbi:hypothetical protein BLNAU_291 [Blattamonas nauphoetae]|uniref:2'-5' RNA ligase n=1 Tax=Blattamonas nauphoetae TaxID=2049346 RepID=A0ABQ9YMJ4_9EUKA|nr:hypothetical protein BLNAU_291 [Blattamonas nauphoetae]
MIVQLSILLSQICYGRTINIHLKVDSLVEELSLQYNQQIRKYDPTMQIFFETVHQPHITLYMTNFQEGCEPTLRRVLQRTTQNLKTGKIFMEKAYASGSYAMWNSTIDSYIQTLSDTIVNATRHLAVQDQPVPQWVKDIKDDVVRERKIKYVKEYGSPNVFEEFGPHVTLGFDSDTKALAAAMKRVKVAPTTYQSLVVAMGTAGPFGTVMRGRDLGYFYLSST